MLGDSLALADVSADSGLWLRSLVHVWLGTARLAQGRPRDALVEIERGLDLAQARGERFVTYVALYNLTQAALALGDVERARGCLAEGVVLAHQTEDLAHVVLYLDAAVVVAAARGALETVAVLVGATEALREAGAGRVYGYYVTDESRRLAAVDLARTSLGLDVFEDLVDTGRSLDPEEFVALLVHGDGAAPRR
jgi:hypothetical protein